MTKDNLKLLVGLTIKKAYINSDQTSIPLETIGDRYVIDHPQDCCELVYIAHVNQAEFLLDSPILRVDEMEYGEVPDGEVPRNNNISICKLGITIHTAKGSVSIDTRLQTDSCYGGDLAVYKSELDKNYSFIEVHDGVELLHQTQKDKIPKCIGKYTILTDF